MIIDRTCEIERVVSADPSRANLIDAYLDTSGGDTRLVATDGHCMAIVPVHDAADDTQGCIPPLALKEARRVQKREPQLRLAANGSVQLPDGRTYSRPTHEFPPWRQVSNPGGEIRARIALNAELLLRLARAIGAAGKDKKARVVELEIRDPLDPVVVRTTNGNGARGLIMPCRA